MEKAPKVGRDFLRRFERRVMGQPVEQDHLDFWTEFGTSDDPSSGKNVVSSAAQHQEGDVGERNVRCVVEHELPEELEVAVEVETLTFQ